MTAASIPEEIDLLISVLPPGIQRALRALHPGADLVEIVLDLGRSPEARTYNDVTVFDELEVTQDDIDHVVERIGDFGDDNRAGIARTLHRISAIRNRKGRIIGLTLRVGRAVYGTVEVIRDIVESGNSILLLGRPGVGKTTVLRETARILADQNRVVIVDTSNEIAGDGDIPHPAIGRARRMQVATPLLQHEVMIEAVENHNPQVIVIDEIGRELEALAARTIAERGVQLIGTAHGNSLDNLLMNPTLSDLIGGIESVTLSDEEARRRGTQKSVLERRAPPTFDVVIEIQTWQRLAIHHAVAAAVDAMLRGRPLTPELRSVSEGGEIVIEKPREADLGRPDGRAPGGGLGWRTGEPAAGFSAEPPGQAPGARIGPLKVFAYGVSQNRLRQSAKALGVPLSLSEDLTDAAALLTLKSYFRKRPVVISDAEARGIPIYVLRSNTTTQIENALVDLFGLTARADPADSAVRETREAIEQILTGSRAMVELSPQGPAIRRQQHELARQASLLSLSRGKEPHRRVRIFRHNGNNG